MGYTVYVSTVIVCRGTLALATPCTVQLTDSIRYSESAPLPDLPTYCSTIALATYTNLIKL